jgi:hypothetical protein
MTLARVLYALQPEVDVPPAAISQGPFEARFALALSSLSPTLRSAAVAALNAPPPVVSCASDTAPVSAASDVPLPQPTKTKALTEDALLSTLDSLRTEKRKIFMSIAAAMERQEAAHQQRLERKRLREESRSKDLEEDRRKKKKKKKRRLEEDVNEQRKLV